MDIVFLHGLNNTGDVFRDVTAALPADIHSHCPTLPPLDNVEALADAVLAAAPERFVLAGYSFGGYVAMAVLEKARDRVAGLCLMGSSAGADSDEQKAKRQQTLSTFDPANYVDTASSSSAPFHPDNRERPDLVARRRELASAYGAQRYVAHVRATMDRKDRSHLLDGSTPTLWLAGTHDAVVPVRRQAEEAAKARNCQYLEIPGAGHLLPLEQPRAVAEALSQWMVRTP
ncbi:alpha/beta fold hydrolase [Hydrogenophaga sp.]|uniref:alpha/beta fold hydrolase n=1 Tax=Hydrogenophaga sp. TaxID=1904254 RepID=UPI00271BE679|nr:alpha/beta hydrolase [Hydrogenophaga sp.]MDO9436402.1 alpha/beta hydrolase [Hydrogenophaga sp.]